MKPDDKIQRKIDGLLGLVRRGVGGEKGQAEKILRKLCDKHGLIYEDVIRREEEPVEQFYITFRNKHEERIAIHSVWKYGGVHPNDIYGHRQYPKRLYYECRKSKHLEVLTAWSVLKAAFKEEMEILRDAFIHRHQIYGEGVKTRKTEEMSHAEYKRALRVAQTAGGLSGVDIHKQLSSPSKLDS